MQISKTSLKISYLRSCCYHPLLQNDQRSSCGQVFALPIRLEYHLLFASISRRLLAISSTVSSAYLMFAPYQQFELLLWLCVNTHLPLVVLNQKYSSVHMSKSTEVLDMYSFARILILNILLWTNSNGTLLH